MSIRSDKSGSLLDFLRPPKPKAVVEVKSSKPRQQFFTNAECRGCPYRGSVYCWNTCSLNVWAKRGGSF
jgi:hypothetical protein